MGELWEAQGQLWEALAELWEALGELWEGLHRKTPDQGVLFKLGKYSTWDGFVCMCISLSCRTTIDARH